MKPEEIHGTLHEVWVCVSIYIRKPGNTQYVYTNLVYGFTSVQMWLVRRKDHNNRRYMNINVLVTKNQTELSKETYCTV